MRAASTMPHPFEADARVELDVAYAAYKIAELAPSGRLQRMRRAHSDALRRARDLLAPLEHRAHRMMRYPVNIAAAAWHVLTIAFMAAVMSWPDEHVARRSFEGCRIVERLPRIILYRAQRAEPATTLQEYLAGNGLDAYERKCRANQDTAEIHDTLLEEVNDNFALPPRRAASPRAV